LKAVGNLYESHVQTPAFCCPGRPAHSRSRAFFQAAAALALIAGGLGGSLTTQTFAADFNNPLGSNLNGSQQFHDSPAMNFTNAGTITDGSVSAVLFYGGQIVTTFSNSGTITNINQNGVGLYTRASQIWASSPSLIGDFNNSGTISGAITGITMDDLADVITTLTNTGTISGGIITGPYDGDAGINISGAGSIGTIENYGIIAGKNSGISNGGSIGTINLRSGSVLTGVNSYGLKNTGSIGAINLFNGSTINNGIFNSGTISSFNADNAGTVSSFINGGTLNNATGNGISLYTSHITTLTNNGTIAGDWAILLNLNSSITTLNNNSNINGATDGINNQGWTGNVNTITTLNNSGSISGGTRWGIASSGVITTLNNSGSISGQYTGIVNWGTITTLNNSGTITGTLGEAIGNSGTIGTLNLLQGSVLSGVINNSGTIGSLNVYKTVTNGNFNSSSLAPTINGNQPGVINRFATVNSGTTVGTFTNSVVLNTLNNAGTITTLTNDSTIGTLNNSGTIGTLNILSGSSITNSILNLGSISTLNFHKTLTNGDFSTSSLGGSIVGNQPGTTNLHATVNSGTTVGTFTNSVVLNTLTNAGTITTLTNSGTIGTITNTGTIGTLNLLGGSTVTDGISNPGTINVLNLTVTGVTSGNYDIAVPGITGNQPLTVNFIGLPTNGHTVSIIRNGRRASVDTSGFGANTNTIRHVSNSVGRLANTNGVIQSIGTKIAKHYADPYEMTSDLCADGAPAQPGQIGNSDFWIRGFMGRNRVDATASSVDYINTYSGGAVGIERDWSENTRAGAFIGAGITDNSLGGGLGGSDADLLFAGAYATKTWGTLFAKVGLTGGRGNNTNTRNIATATPESAVAEFNSWYVSPEVSIGKVYDLGQHLGGTFSVTPVLSVRYVYAHQDGYTETGATNNLTMNNSHSTTIEERAELKFSYATKAFNDYGVKINASVGGIGQQNSGGAMSGTLLGAPLSFATPGDDNTTGFVGGLGFEINRGKYTFTASGDYVRLSGGNADLSANVVFSVKF
jgi:hypothetical protein